MNIHILNPLSDARWDALVSQNRHSSVFHQRGWLEALSRTYGYEPRVLTPSPTASPLESALLFCRVTSWLTGTRLVSLPFADHCEPLLSDPSELCTLAKWLRDECDRQSHRYVEFRPISDLQIAESGLKATGSFWLHELDLAHSSEKIFDRLHKNSFQRKIRRAEKEHLSYDVGRSQEHVHQFYQLQMATRRRHQLLPQPRNWFANLIKYMGDKAEIRIARKGGLPIAAMLTIRHRSHLVYKYGCSSAEFHPLGGMPFLFWRLIEECKSAGIDKIDLGRSDLDHTGLVTFKDRLGASKRLLAYYRYTNAGARPEVAPWRWWGLRKILPNLPQPFFSKAGGVFYKHMG